VAGGSLVMLGEWTFRNVRLLESAVAAQADESKFAES